MVLRTVARFSVEVLAPHAAETASVGQRLLEVAVAEECGESEALLAPLGAFVCLVSLINGTSSSRLGEVSFQLSDWLRQSESPTFRVASWMEARRICRFCGITHLSKARLTAYVSGQAQANRGRFHGDLMAIERAQTDVREVLRLLCSMVRGRPGQLISEPGRRLRLAPVAADAIPAEEESGAVLGGGKPGGHVGLGHLAAAGRGHRLLAVLRARSLACPGESHRRSGLARPAPGWRA